MPMDYCGFLPILLIISPVIVIQVVKTPELHKISGKAWEATKARVRKSVKKLAVDLINIYAQRAQKSGFAYPSG
jgi:transcription-repair coupling factor (superfamily II helicase)